MHTLDVNFFICIIMRRDELISKVLLSSKILRYFSTQYLTIYVLDGVLFWTYPVSCCKIQSCSQFEQLGK